MVIIKYLKLSFELKLTWGIKYLELAFELNRVNLGL